MAPSVKSAIRVLEIFEFFDRIQREATVREIARTLGYPVSSTSVLMSNLAELGYMGHGADQRSYFPTPRVALLGAWIDPMLAPGGEVLQMMADLGDQTGETIILASPTRDLVRYLHVVPATTTMRMHVGPGTTRPLLLSGLGRLLLSTMSDTQVRDLAMRHNEGPHAAQMRVSLAALRRDISVIRTQGYSVTLRGVTPGAGVIGMLLPLSIGGVPLAIGIGGWARSMRAQQQQLVDLLRSRIHRYLGGTAKDIA